MSEWQLSPAAQIDLEDIWLFTANQWGTAQADDYVRDIRDILSEAAHGSPLARPIDDVRSGYWRIRAGQHHCYFDKIASGDIVAIRILHERMDVAARLLPPAQ